MFVIYHKSQKSTFSVILLCGARLGSATFNMINTKEIRALLEKASAGEQDAFEAVYKELYDPVFRYIYIRVKNRQDAEDIAQTTFMKVYQSIDRFSVTEHHPLAFFFTVARNTIIDRARRKKNEPVANDELLLVYDKGKEEDFEKEERLRYIEKILSQLNEDDRRLITLSEIEGYGGKEISEILGKSEVAIRKQKQRALEKLRKIINEKQKSHEEK